MVGANCAPYIDTFAKNELTRIMYIPLGEGTDELLSRFCKVNKDGSIARDRNGVPRFIGGEFKKAILREMPGILSKAHRAYDELCVNGQDILLPDEHLDLVERQCADPLHDKLVTWLDSDYIIEDDQEMPASAFYISFLDDITDNDYSYDKALRYLKTTFGVSKGERINGKLRIPTLYGIGEK